jgi:hypothetical protein
MLIIPLLVVLLVCLCGGFAFAASRGYRIPVGICLALIIVGGFLAVAPSAFSFLLQALGRSPHFTEGYLTDGERMACWVPSAILFVVGILGAVFSRRAGGSPPK